jgi:hypothetical protein
MADRLSDWEAYEQAALEFFQELRASGDPR